MSLSAQLARTLTNYSSEDSFGSRLRKKRLEPLLSMIEAAHREQGRVEILDLGGTRTYWNIVPEDRLQRNNAHVTIANLPEVDTPSDNALFSYVQADACNLDRHADQSFDIVHSNSVIEHVGDWTRMQQFAHEVRRVGRRYFVQTPSFSFPIEPHCMTPFFHWLPEPVRIRAVMHFQLGHWEKQDTVSGAVQTVQSARLLTKGMLAALFPDATVLTERLALLPKSYTAIKDTL